jgi:GNAT superfamily N-acetyltransferase
MSTNDGYEIRALTPDTWELFEGLAGRHNGIFSGCWCTWFHPDCAERGQTSEGNRALKEQWVRDGIAHAALVIDSSTGTDEAIAWAEYGTPEELPGIHHRKQYDAEADLIPDYRITCIFVDRRYRRNGLAETAAQGAIDLIAQAGGGVVESYPHEVDPDKKMSASFLYNGTRRMYERLGFDYIRPKGLKNCVMRRTVKPAARRTGKGRASAKAR